MEFDKNGFPKKITTDVIKLGCFKDGILFAGSLLPNLKVTHVLTTLVQKENEEQTMDKIWLKLIGMMTTESIWVTFLTQCQIVSSILE